MEAAGGGDLEVSADAGHAVQLGVVPAPQRRQLVIRLLLVSDKRHKSSEIRLLNNKYSVIWMEPALCERSEVKAGCS